MNKIEQALGFYVDEFGAVYNAQHEFIRLTAEARKEIADNKAAYEKAAEDAAEKEKMRQTRRLRRVSAQFKHLDKQLVPCLKCQDNSRRCWRR